MKHFGRVGLIFLAAVLVTGGAVVAGAAFTDTDQITGNTAQAATFDLKVSAGSGWGDSAWGAVVVQDLAPGCPTGEYSFWYMNSVDSDIDGKMSFKMSYVDCDAPEMGEFWNLEVSPNTFAKSLWIVSAKLNGAVQSPGIEEWWAQQIMDENGGLAAAEPAGMVVLCGGKYVPTLFGMKQCTFVLAPYGGPSVCVAPGESYCNQLVLMLDPAAGNEFQDDGVAVTIDVTMDQCLP